MVRRIRYTAMLGIVYGVGIGWSITTHRWLLLVLCLCGAVYCVGSIVSAVGFTVNKARAELLDMLIRAKHAEDENRRA